MPAADSSRRLTSLATILLPGPPGHTLEGIRECFQRHWPEMAEMAGAEIRDAVLSWSYSGQEIYVSRMAAPMPWGDLEGPCATSVLWKNATAEVMTHKEHLLVVIMGEAAPVERARLLTRITAALLLANPSALGVSWASSAVVVPAAIFLDFALKILPSGPPLWIWVDFRVGANPDGSAAGFTQGMAGLGLMEMETRNAMESPAALRERLNCLAAYLIDKGMVIQQGHSVGTSAEEVIVVEFGPSSFGHAGDVMKLNYGAVASRWKYLTNDSLAPRPAGVTLDRWRFLFRDSKARHYLYGSILFTAVGLASLFGGGRYVVGGIFTLAGVLTALFLVRWLKMHREIFQSAALVPGILISTVPPRILVMTSLSTGTGDGPWGVKLIPAPYLPKEYRIRDLELPCVASYIEGSQEDRWADFFPVPLCLGSSNHAMLNKKKGEISEAEFLELWELVARDRVTQKVNRLYVFKSLPSSVIPG